jgi:hypothetical protein
VERPGNPEREDGSRRLVTRDLPDLRREHVFGGFEIEARLHVHPERAAGLEELAEPQRGVGGRGFSSRAMRLIWVRGTFSAAATEPRSCAASRRMEAGTCGPSFESRREETASTSG